jgi:hypothetical protein
MATVPASEGTRNALKDMLAGKSEADKSSLVRQVARLIVEEAGDAADALGGRGYYEHGTDRAGLPQRQPAWQGKDCGRADWEFAMPQRLWADYHACAGRECWRIQGALSLRRRHRREAAPGQAREAVLGAWGITETGHKVLLGSALRTKEDTASCRDFLMDLKSRGLIDPIPGATDGAPG